MCLSSQLFFETHHKTLKFHQKSLLLLQTKNINKIDTMEVFSTYICTKNHVFQQCTSYASAVRKTDGNAFPGNVET